MNARTQDAVNAAIAQVSERLAADPGRAEADARGLLRHAPNDPRVRLILASALRRRGANEEALTILRPLAMQFPRAARTQYELGLVLAAQGDARGGAAALRKAVDLDREFPEAWRALGEALFRAGDAEGADAAFAWHSRTMVRDPALRPAADALYTGRLDEAEALLTRHLSARPSDRQAARLLGELLIRRERYAPAEQVLARVLQADPTDHGARFSYATALFQQQKGQEALHEIERLLAVDPHQAAYLNLKAGALALLGDFPSVIETYETLLRAYEGQARVWLNYGHALRTIGRSADAVAAYRRAIALAPETGDAYWSLANLKMAPLTEADEAMMQRQVARPDIGSEDRLHLHYALGKALEDRKQYQAAFEHYAAGARVRKAMIDYDSGVESRLMAGARAVFTPAFIRARDGWGCSDPDPIFVVGLPRSGSTLIEQILASHSQIEGTMELPDIGFISMGLDQAATARGAPGYPQCLNALTAAEAQALGRLYLDRTRVQRRLGRPHFIDKMPNNFRHVGLIQLILPNAKIIDARRHPMGVCFSAFKQHFAQGQGFTYDLADLGRFYRDYVGLMAHFDRVTPGRVCRVIYEDMVEDTEAQVRRLLDFCGVPFEDGCLKFYETERAVRTVSSEQVRRPIYRGGLEQWRNFEPWLKPLENALGPALACWRGEDAPEDL